MANQRTRQVRASASAARSAKRSTRTAPPTSSTDAGNLFRIRTGIDPFTDGVVATALAFGATAEVMGVVRDLDMWIAPMTQTMSTLRLGPNVPTWARYVLSCLGTEKLTINTPTESIDLVKVVDDVHAHLTALEAACNVLQRAANAVITEQFVGTERHRFIPPRGKGRPTQLGRAKFAARLVGTWSAAGRAELAAEDLALLAIAFGLEPVPSSSTSSRSGASAWDLAIDRWRVFAREHPPRSP